MLKFSAANTKIKALSEVKSLAKFLSKGKKVYSLDLLSGWSCPFAQDCLSKVIVTDGKRKIKDGPDTEFRCFSASQEALYPAVYNLRKNNYDQLKLCNTYTYKKNLILTSLPKNAGIIRVHVGGDFFNADYFRAWLRVAQVRPDVLFYAYTKSLKYWIENRAEVDRTENFVLTASRGGRLDHLIDKAGLRSSIVVYSVAEAEKLGLEIDHDDSHAADPSKRNQNFALLIHGSQPVGSDAGKAVRALNGIGSYGRETKSVK